MMAVARGDLQTLKKLIEWGIDLNKYSVDEITPVMLAAKQGTRSVSYILHPPSAQISRIAYATDLRSSITDIAEPSYPIRTSQFTFQFTDS